MAQERFYIVNGHDQPIYTAVGKEAMHALNVLHRGVHVLIEVFGGKFLIQKKANHTENGGKWSSAVSGHVRESETYEAAAIREAKEELGIKIDEGDLYKVAKIPACDDTDNEFVGLFTYLLNPAEESLELLSGEVDETIICSLDDLIEDVGKNLDRYSPAFIHVFNMFLVLEKKMEA